jgi:hypothetical protein
MNERITKRRNQRGANRRMDDAFRPTAPLYNLVITDVGQGI